MMAFLIYVLVYDALKYIFLQRKALSSFKLSSNIQPNNVVHCRYKETIKVLDDSHDDFFFKFSH